MVGSIESGMSKEELAKRKPIIANAIFLAMIILGIGCISWAVLEIWGQPDYIAEDVGVQYPAFAITTDELVSNLIETEKNLYPVYPQQGETVGSLIIPALQKKLPIIQGTGVADLKKGVGHFMQSVLPGRTG